jgi:ubiquitin-like protein Pup
MFPGVGNRLPGQLSGDVDAIPDETGEVLEENAGELVRSRVQKGGR